MDDDIIERPSDGHRLPPHPPSRDVADFRVLSTMIGGCTSWTPIFGPPRLVYSPCSQV